MIKNLIFDFDGTISDSYPHFMEIMELLAKKHGWHIPCHGDELLRELLVSVKAAHKKFGWNQLMPYDDFWDEFSMVQAEKAAEFHAFPEAIDLIQYAKQKGMQCFIYTHSGKVVAQKMLSNMKIDQYITYTIDKSMGFRSKPDPEALLYLIEKFSLNPAECLMIGDRPIDAECGKNAGMRGCLWDTYGIFGNEKPDIYVTKLEDVKKYI